MNLIKTKVLEIDFTFETKGGVFSAREIDPGTRLLAENTPSFAKAAESKSILDLGCGYGCLGIVAAKINPAAEVMLGDDSLRATRMAERNVELNQVKNAKVVLSDGFSDLEGEFDLILSNLPLGYGNELVEELILGATNRLREGGEMLVVTQNRFKDLMKGWFEKYLGGFEIVTRGKEHFVCRSGIHKVKSGENDRKR